MKFALRQMEWLDSIEKIIMVGKYLVETYKMEWHIHPTDNDWQIANETKLLMASRYFGKNIILLKERPNL